MHRTTVLGWFAPKLKQTVLDVMGQNEKCFVLVTGRKQKLFRRVRRGKAKDIGRCSGIGKKGKPCKTLGADGPLLH